MWLIADAPITSPRTYEEFCEGLKSDPVVAGACAEADDAAPRILMELTTGYLETTSSRLFDEYVVERGVSEKDLAEKNHRLLDHLFHLRNLEDPGRK